MDWFLKNPLYIGGTLFLLALGSVRSSPRAGEPDMNRKC